MEELESKLDQWDLVYIGRKILHNSKEDLVADSEQLVYVDYTYWTLGYIITRAGADKLLSAGALGQMVPVDEFLPIMYNRHPNTTWAQHFNNRSLPYSYLYQWYPYLGGRYVRKTNHILVVALVCLSVTLSVSFCHERTYHWRRHSLFLLVFAFEVGGGENSRRTNLLMEIWHRYRDFWGLFAF